MRTHGGGTDRHGTEEVFIVDEGVVGGPLVADATDGQPVTEDWRAEAPAAEVDGVTALEAAAGSAPRFRFSRLGPRGGSGRQPSPSNLRRIARENDADGVGFSRVPAGYLGQFIDHDLTMDRTKVMLGDRVTPAMLLQGRSPSLDLDALYGAGPQHPRAERFCWADGARLKTGRSVGCSASRP